MEDKRAVSRRRTYLDAQLSSQNGILWSDATVRNLSEGGALVFVKQATIPDPLEITIPQTSFRARARVVWRGNGHAGLRFETAPARVAPAKPIARPHGDDPNY